MANKQTLSLFRGKNRDELLELFNENAHAGDAAYEIQKWVFTFRCVEDIERAFDRLTGALNDASTGSEKLAQQIVALTRILTWATVLAAVATVAGVIVAALTAFHH